MGEALVLDHSCPEAEVSKGMLPVETTCSNKILIMTARKHGHQRLGWTALVYQKQKGAVPDSGPHKHCLQKNGKSDEQLGVRVRTWNIGSMRWIDTELCDWMWMDLCCLQGVRWRGHSAERSLWV